MNLKLFRTSSVPEIALLIVFVIYIIFPISTPEIMVPMVDSPLGYVTIFMITISLFIYTTPLLGILYIFVAYELIRRSSAHSAVNLSHSVNDTIPTQYMPTNMPKPMTPQSIKDAEINKMNIPHETTLEEEIVEMRAPIGKSDPVHYTESSFKPIADKLSGASMFYGLP